ncbi:nuclear transport factor 2 family protein [Kyrpidia tusciae]|uniref:nuclear transport factor 2 family protein n=1 Tax=Kyrpidia tusciae TaxID=33943 RepID=UPI000F51769D
MTVPEEVRRTVHTCISAWNEADETTKQRLFEQSWVEDGTYTDPSVHVEGRDALMRHSQNFAVRWPGAEVVLTSGIVLHHGMVCFTWRVVGPDGRTLREGIDVGELAADGRLRRVVGFFGPFPNLDDCRWEGRDSARAVRHWSDSGGNNKALVSQKTLLLVCGRRR